MDQLGNPLADPGIKPGPKLLLFLLREFDHPLTKTELAGMTGLGSRTIERWLADLEWTHKLITSDHSNRQARWSVSASLKLQRQPSWPQPRQESRTLESDIEDVRQESPSCMSDSPDVVEDDEIQKLAKELRIAAGEEDSAEPIPQPIKKSPPPVKAVAAEIARRNKDLRKQFSRNLNCSLVAGVPPGGSGESLPPKGEEFSQRRSFLKEDQSNRREKR